MLHLPIYLYKILSAYLSINPLPFLSIYLFIYLSRTYLFISFPTHIQSYPSIYIILYIMYVQQIHLNTYFISTHRCIDLLLRFIPNSTFLTILLYTTPHPTAGPPGEPGGVHARGNSNDESFQGELELWWQKGRKHGFAVSTYTIEYRSFYDQENVWSVLIDGKSDKMYFFCFYLFSYFFFFYSLVFCQIWWEYLPMS